VRRARRRAAWTAAFVIVALPLFVAAILELLIDRPPLTGDVAATELAVMNAGAFEQLIGSYSRLGFNHPGPLQFYMLVPLYFSSGEASTALFETTILCNLAALGGIAAVWFTEHRGAPARMLLLALLSVFLASFGRVELNYWELLSPLSAVWNPVCVVLPFGALLVLSSAAASGRTLALPPAVALHAFVVQTHVVTGLAATALLATAAVFTVRSPSGDLSRSRRAVFLSLGVALLLWAPTLVDQVAGRGNLAIVAGMLFDKTSVSVWDAILHPALHMAFWSLPLRVEQSSSAMQAVAITGMVVEVALLFAAYRTARARAQGFAMASCLLGLLVILSACVTLRRVDDPRFFYLTSWLPIVAALNWSSVGAVLAIPRAGPRLREWLVYASAAVIALSTTFSIAHVLDRARSRTLATYKSNAVEIMLPVLERQLQVFPGIALRADQGGQGLLPGLALALVKRGVTPAVSNDWCPDLGERVRCVARTRPELVVTDSERICSRAIAKPSVLMLCLENVPAGRSDVR
jgi:hypothetical protein